VAFQALVENLSFSEGPRWRDGRLYYSDFYRHVVEAVDLTGKVEVIAEVANQPSGLGWLPDGRMLMVSMLDRKLLRREGDGALVEHADLSNVATWHCNDMVVDRTGRAYVGNFGYDLENRNATSVLAKLALVEPDGAVSVAAEDLNFPNGSVITPDGKTLILAETMGRCLTAFDIEDLGALNNRREWANVYPHFPDGICLDTEGGVWVADPGQGKVIRVLEGGEMTHEFEVGTGAFACALGAGRLFVSAAKTSGAGAASSRSGQILCTDVPFESCGSP
jgi:sugar lactone lactonase YvrE